jgi:SAM-dependent methyltransferase
VETKFSAAEAQLLALVQTLEMRPWDWESGQPVRPTIEVLERHGPVLYGADFQEWGDAYVQLVDGGLLSFDGVAYSVTERGRDPARSERRRFSSDIFGRKLAAIARSAAYRALCERVFDLSVDQYSPLDRIQLDSLLDGLALSPDDRLLDFGCGNGGVALAIAERTGAHVTGIDLAEAAIEVAARRVPRQGRLRFFAADGDRFRAESGSFDGVVAVDSLYYLDHPVEAVERLARAVRPGGRLGFFCSDLAPAGDRSGSPSIAPDRTVVGRALSGLGLPFRTIDFTAAEGKIWSRQLAAAEDLQEDFQSEGNSELGQELVREAQRGVRWAAAGMIRRYLYLADVALPRDPGGR